MLRFMKLTAGEWLGNGIAIFVSEQGELSYPRLEVSTEIRRMFPSLPPEESHETHNWSRPKIHPVIQITWSHPKCAQRTDDCFPPHRQMCMIHSRCPCVCAEMSYMVGWTPYAPAAGLTVLQALVSNSIRVKQTVHA